MKLEEIINLAIDFGNKEIKGFDDQLVSDEYHTFGDLYEFRKMYNAVLFNEWAAQGKFEVHKSIRHNDNELCFGGGWFIVVAVFPDGRQISNHYKLEDWDLFNVPDSNKALYPFDGHTPDNVLERLREIARSQEKRLYHSHP